MNNKELRKNLQVLYNRNRKRRTGFFHGGPFEYSIFVPSEEVEPFFEIVGKGGTFKPEHVNSLPKCEVSFGMYDSDWKGGYPSAALLLRINTSNPVEVIQWATINMCDDVELVGGSVQIQWYLL